MLDMKFVRENPELVMDAMRKRNANVNLDEFLELEKKRRESRLLKASATQLLRKSAK